MVWLKPMMCKAQSRVASADSGMFYVYPVLRITGSAR